MTKRNPMQARIYDKDGVLVKISLPTLKELARRVYDAEGKRIDLEAVVTNIEPIPSSSESGDVPINTVLKVQARAGAGFYLTDPDGEVHIASGKSLKVIIHGNPNRPARANPHDSFLAERASVGNQRSAEAKLKEKEAKVQIA